MKTQAWVLHKSTSGGSALDDGGFRLEDFELPEMGDEDLLVEPLFGSWEGNMSHAIERDPVDICLQRREEKVVLGNLAVVRIVGKGRQVPSDYQIGDVGLFNGLTSPAYLDHYGYMALAHGYDMPRSIGFLCKQNVMPYGVFFHLPESDFSLAQWAAFGLKFPTAYSNWMLARSVYRLQVPEAWNPSISVVAWGGGCSLAQLDLARQEGHKTLMLTGNEARKAFLASRGIDAVDSSGFGDLDLETDPSPAARRRYASAFGAFRRALNAATDGAGVDIFVDYINDFPLSTRRIVNRLGIVTTAGWKKNTDYSMNRPTECIRRRTHLHTHYCHADEFEKAVAHALATGWMPWLDGDPVYEWDEIRDLADLHIRGASPTLFPVYRVNAH